MAPPQGRFQLESLLRKEGRRSFYKRRESSFWFETQRPTRSGKIPGSYRARPRSSWELRGNSSQWDCTQRDRHVHCSIRRNGKVIQDPYCTIFPTPEWGFTEAEQPPAVVYPKNDHRFSSITRIMNFIREETEVLKNTSRNMICHCMHNHLWGYSKLMKF